MSTITSIHTAVAASYWARLALQRVVAAAAKCKTNPFVAAAVCYTTFQLLRGASWCWHQGVAKTWKLIAGTALHGIQAIPGAAAAIEAQLEPELQNIRRELLGAGDADAHLALPVRGLPAAEVLGKCREQKARAAGYASGQLWAGIYHEPESELVELQNRVWAEFNNTNTLYPGVFPGVRKFEAELVAMVLAMVHGADAGAVGLLTSGGTESILLAVLGYREQGKARGVDEPEIICGLSAHPALHKACHYFGVKLVTAALDPGTLQLEPAAVARLITPRTVAVYASCPSFTHGVIDPVERLGALCRDRGLGLHVDNCLGGFLVSHLCKLGLLGGLRWDFEVPGVTSISVDLHKYGFASKGVSVVCFRDPALRRRTYVPCSSGCEGLYVTPTLQGSRAGAIIAQAWATALYMGADGYDRMARQIHDVTAEVKRIVGSIPELGVLVDSHAAIVPVVSRSSRVNIYQVASLLEEKGWNMFTGQHPPVMSVCLGEQHARLLGQWGEDLREAVATTLANPGLKVTGGAAVYGTAAAIPDQLLDSILRSYCDIRISVKAAPAAPGPTGTGADQHPTPEPAATADCADASVEVTAAAAKWGAGRGRAGATRGHQRARSG